MFSLVRQLYHQWIPEDLGQRVVFGLPDIWNQPKTINGDYGSYTWSPCGQSFSARTLTSVGVWDTLTLEKHSTLQLTDSYTTTTWDSRYYLPDVLAYSPDGYSLAGCFGPVIIVWDIQTGGVVNEIECGIANVLPKSLVWLSDGKTIGAIFPVEVGTWVVYTYDVTLEVNESTSTIQSLLQPHLWSHDNSLWAMVVLDGESSQATINILKIWPIPADNLIESFSINLDLKNELPTISFSPATYRISAIVYKNHRPHVLLAFDIHSSNVLLQKRGYFTANCLSPDGSVLVASGMNDSVYVWRYTSEQNYIIWKEFPFWSGSSEVPRGYRFSPGASLMLVSRDDFLEVQHLENPNADYPERGTKQYGEFSTNGTYVVTASCYEQIITVTNLYDHFSQVIDTTFPICGLALTGNIILVEGSNEIVGWRLTAEGMVDKVSNDGEETYENSIWTKTVSGAFAKFQVEGHIGVVELSKEDHFYYNTETGEELESILIDLHPSSTSWKNLEGGLDFGDQHSSSYQDFIIYDDLPEDDPPISMPWYQGGWIKYSEGEHQHRFWLPTHWRPDWHEGHWHDNSRAIRLVTASGLVIIKF